MARAYANHLNQKVVVAHTGSTGKKNDGKFTIKDLCLSVIFFHDSEIKLYVVGGTVIFFLYPLLMIALIKC